MSVSGVDLLDGTPVLDIKPYIPYVDCIPEASNLLAASPPERLDVQFSDIALQQMAVLQKEQNTDLRALIEEILGQDPRPAYQQLDETRSYGVTILNFELKWRYSRYGDGVQVEVLALNC